MKTASEEKRALSGLPAALIAAAALVAAVSALRGFGLSAPVARSLAALSDGFFVAGALVGGLGVLVWVGSTGFFDMIAYGLQGLWIRLTPFLHPSGQKPFYDYKVARAKKRRSPSWALLLVGGGCVALAGLLLFLYYRLR